MFNSTSSLSNQTNRKFKAHVQAHKAVTNNESWFTNKPPNLGQGFSAADTAERRTTVMEILLRAAKRADKNEDADLKRSTKFTTGSKRAFFLIGVGLSLAHVAPERFRRPRSSLKRLPSPRRARTEPTSNWSL
jgi:hypothetical protein